MEKLFGTDGIRGRANQFPTTPEIALALGKALGSLLRRQKGRHRVVIGKDTRRSCYFLENAIVSGLCSMGIDTLMLGPVPTPAVAFITQAYRAAAGIMISASHNPFYDNGIKVFSSEGYKLSRTFEAEMEAIIHEGNYIEAPLDADIGQNKRIDDVSGRYIEHLKNAFSLRGALNGMKLFLDCAHGAAYRVAPLTFWELGAEVITTADQPDGLNINEKCGALFPRKIQEGVVAHQADVGIALDGDGDRVIMSDELGNLIDGDTILAICAKEMMARGELKNNKVVGTVMTNYGMMRYLESLGIEVILSNVGDRYVIAEMLRAEAYLGGEQSGHLIFREHSTTGDGILSALQVLGIMLQSGKRLSELAADIPHYPQVLHNVQVRAKPPLEQLQRVQSVIQDVEHELRGEGRVLVRYSGTENLCRVMVEGKEQEVIEQMAVQIANEIKDEIGACVESLAT